MNNGHGENAHNNAISDPGQTVLVSFSGGLTSAKMSFLLKKYAKCRLVFVFANTGQENEETLRFVERCDNYFNLGVVWVEAVVNSDGVGTSHKIVNFSNASRKGEPFNDVMSKYGISNVSYPHCTRELKEAPIHSFMKTITKNYTTSIGIRADEYRRVKNKQKIIYPLAGTWIETKDSVNNFWKKQPFSLQLKDYQGNCKWCWKKSLRKHFRLIEETPEIFNFPREMENLYGDVRCEYGSRVFFRENRSTNDLFSLKKYRKQMSLFELDIDSGCSESCDMYETI